MQAVESDMPVDKSHSQIPKRSVLSSISCNMGVGQTAIRILRIEDPSILIAQYI